MIHLPEVPAWNEKTKRIIAGSANGNEPIFILRARDVLSIHGIEDYIQKLRILGQENPEFLEEVEKIKEQFYIWQQQNPTLVKYPD